MIAVYNIVKFIIYLLLTPVIIILWIKSGWFWNNGICRKCKSHGYDMIDYNSDRIQVYKFSCDGCSFKFRSLMRYEKISSEDVISKVRDYKLGKIVN